MARGFGLGGGSAIGGDATPEDILIGKTAYVDGKKTIGTMPNNESHIQDIDSKEQQIIIPYGYHDGTGYVQMNPDDQLRLISSNIRKDITILGETGTLDEGTDTSDATAIAGDILYGKTGYVKDAKIIGSITSKSATTLTPSTSAQTAVSAGIYCSGNITVNAIPNQQNGGAWTPSTSAQTMVAANKYLKTAVTVNAIPNQTDGGTKYATTSAQTLLTAPKYLKTDLKIGALSQSNLAAGNILRGKTITISNGSSNVWSVSGSNSVLKYTSGHVTGGATTKSFYDDTGKEHHNTLTTITGHGITPAIVIWLGDSLWGMREGNLVWRIWDDPATGTGAVYCSNSKNSTWSFTSSTLDIWTGKARADVWYWIFGY